MRTTITLVLLAATPALATPPTYDVEVYYDVVAMAGAPSGHIAGAVGFGGQAVAAIVDPEQQVHDFPHPDISYSSFTTMNDNAMAFGLGWTLSDPRFLSWSPDDGFIDIGPMPGLYNGDIVDCNDLGHAITWIVDDTIPSKPTLAMRWDGDQWTSLGSLREDPNAWTAVTPHAINNQGAIVGSATSDAVNDQGGLTTRAFIWTPEGGMIDLGSLGDPTTPAIALDINQSGVAAGLSYLVAFEGRQAVIWSPEGDVIPITDGRELSLAQIITDSNVVFGTVENGLNPRRAFKWNETDGYLDLGTLDDTNFERFVDANDQAVAVGYSVDDFYQVFATVYIPGEGLLDLNALIPDEFADHWLSAGVDVRDDGTIVATGFGPNDEGVPSFFTAVLTPQAACSADFNGDANLDILDFVAFQAAWQAADPDADCNTDGEHNVLDFVCFQSAFQGGCP